jgi:acetolactate synthase I/II/III large subunit
MADSPFPAATQQGTDSAAEVLLKSMKVNGIDYMFVNPGTDFAPLIEGLAAGKRKGAVIPNLMVIPHENTAVSMAHGYYMVSGQPPTRSIASLMPAARTCRSC